MSGTRNSYVAILNDDESVRRALCRLLRAAGLQPIGYSSVASFLDDRNQPRFGCLVLDIRMEGTSDTGLRQHPSEAGGTVPIVFVTAHDDLNEREDAIAAGCAGFFCKSDAGDSILAAIRAAMEMR
ncbi:MAG: response regulator [Phycisphaerales bacterium]